MTPIDFPARALDTRNSAAPFLFEGRPMSGSVSENGGKADSLG